MSVFEQIKMIAADVVAGQELASEKPESAAFHASEAVRSLTHLICFTYSYTSGVEIDFLDVSASILPDEHEFKTDLLALDALRPVETVKLFPNPGGNTPTSPPAYAIDAALSDIEALLPEVYRFLEDWSSDV